MKKIITTVTLLVALLTSVHASIDEGFEFGDVFKDLKVAQEAAQANFAFDDVFNDLKVAQETTHANFQFGDVFKDLK